MKKIILNIIMTLIPTCYAVGLTTNVDSLKTILESDTLSNEHKLELYEELGDYYSTTEKIDSAAYYYNNGIELANQIGNKRREGLFHLYFSILHALQRDGATNPLTVEYVLKAIEIFESIDDKENIAYTYARVGQHFILLLHDYKRGLHYTELAKEYAKGLNSIKCEYEINWNMAWYYLFNDDAQNALLYSDKVMELVEKDEKPLAKVEALRLKGDIYFYLLHDYSIAEECALEGLKISKEYEAPSLMINHLALLSEIYHAQKRYSDSRDALLQAWETDSLKLPIPYLTNLVSAYFQLGEPEKGQQYLENYVYAKEEMYDKELQKTLSEAEVGYQTEKKDIKIASLEKEKRLYIFIILLAAISLTALLFLYFIHRRFAQQKLLKLEQEKQLTAAEAVIEGETAERSRLARDLHDGLGGMLAAVKINLDDIEKLQLAREMLNNSIEELRRVAHHLMPASLLRFGMKTSLEDFCRSFPNIRFHYIGDDRRISEKIEVLIYRCVYELVNNAIKHSGADQINVQLSIIDNKILLTVQDNGKGFDINACGEGMGLENLRTRLAAFGGKMDIETAPGEGVETTIELKVSL